MHTDVYDAATAQQAYASASAAVLPPPTAAPTVPIKSIRSIDAVRTVPIGAVRIGPVDPIAVSLAWPTPALTPAVYITGDVDFVVRLFQAGSASRCRHRARRGCQQRAADDKRRGGESATKPFSHSFPPDLLL